MSDERHVDAEGEIRAALCLDPQNAELHVNLGRALARKGDHEGALAEYREALRLNPKNGDVCKLVFSELIIEGYAEEAMVMSREEGAHCYLGLYLREKGDSDAAIAEFREALRLNPGNIRLHYYLGAVLGEKGDLDGAIAEYREAIRLNPKEYDAHGAVGEALASKGDWDGAITEYCEALLLNPKSGSAHFNLGLALGQKRRLGRGHRGIPQGRAPESEPCRRPFPAWLRVSANPQVPESLARIPGGLHARPQERGL